MSSFETEVSVVDVTSNHHILACDGAGKSGGTRFRGISNVGDIVTFGRMDGKTPAVARCQKLPHLHCGPSANDERRKLFLLVYDEMRLYLHSL